MAIPERDHMVYLDRVETKWPLRIQLPIGTTVPLHCTASGKMYLASLRPSYLDRFLAATELTKRTAKTLTSPAALKAEIATIRRDGVSKDNQEFLDGMAAVAVPVLDDQGRLLSTLSVHAPVQRISLDSLLSYRDKLRETSESLSSLLLEEHGDSGE